jgi:uncharacterized protein (DUF4415 family)
MTQASKKVGQLGPTMKGLKLGTILPTAEEDADITAAADSDPDNPIWTDEDFKRASLGGRPRSPNPKRHVSLRIDPDTADYFVGLGKGWQSKINEVLTEYVRSHK